MNDVTNQLLGVRSLSDLQLLLSKIEIVSHESKICTECGTDVTHVSRLM